MSVALRIARRELRGGLKGFRIFLACLTLGVAAIAAVGSVRVSIEEGLRSEGAVILGGDAEMSFTYRFASDEERAFMADVAGTVSETVDFRSMVVVDRNGETERGLTQVRGVDGAYPIYGQVELSPNLPLPQALAITDRPGAVMDQLLIDRLALEIGDIFRLGTQEFELRAALVTEPDGASGGFGLGPRTIVSLDGLEGSGLLTPGTLFDSQYRLGLPQGANLPALADSARDQFEETGMRWRDSRNGAPGVQEFISRIGAFLVLVGLAGLAVGGVGVSAAVKAYLDGKIDTIATLKTLGAESRTIFTAYFSQIGLLTLIGIVLGLILGAALPLIFSPLIAAQLPVPIAFSVYPAPLAEAALYGLLTALIFTLWPLARSEQVRAAALFRDATDPSRALPRAPYLIVITLLAVALVALAVWLSGIPTLALGAAGGILGALILLALASFGIRRLARRLSRARFTRGRTALRAALGSVGGPGSEAISVVLSLGLGLTVLAAVGQIDSNLRAAIQRDLPDVAPSYFFVDIQSDQLPGFLDRVQGDAQVSRVDTAPMLRGIITRINGIRAAEVAGDHWVLQGDRGVTYTITAPPEEEIVAGTWWPDDYSGPPLVAFAAEEALEMGIGVGDEITVNILGRDITAEIAALREVSFENAGIGFILTMSQNALAGAPHTHIATVYAEEEAEAAILRDVAGDAPNITAIRVRDALDRVAEALRSLAAATSYGAAATLVTGFIVLIGAAAAGERRRVFEAAVLKTLGASRARILGSFALRSALLGAAAGVVAIFAGALGGWAVVTLVMETSYAFEPVSALAIIFGGALATLLAGLGFARLRQDRRVSCARATDPLAKPDRKAQAGLMLRTFRSLLPGGKRGGQSVPADAVPDLPRPETATYVVGDIHGRADLLEKVLERIDAHIGGSGSTNPQLVFVGDYLDHGPQSATVLTRLRELTAEFPQNVTCLMGNHERMLLDFLADPALRGPRWLREGGAATLVSHGVKPAHLTAEAEATAWQEAALALAQALGPDTLGWLRDRPLSWSSGNLWVVHAGADPQRPMPDQTARVLLWGHPEFDVALRGDGMWVAHGHVELEDPMMEDGRIAVDTGAWHTNRLTACAIHPDGTCAFLET